MHIEIREYLHSDNKAVTDIWNQVVEDGNAFPQGKSLSYEDADAFFKNDT